jgi:branched-chain amino acid transport system permease protein
MIAKPRLALLIALIACAVVSQFSGHINPYYLDVIISIGINIILAVSLNLINGYTGQFSMGHAGFMAVGGYTAAVITTTFGHRLLPVCGGQAWLLFSVALVIGGLLAAVAGLAVGAPSLRLKGDYLAIVTLGFNQIIIVILQNMDVVGGARGFTGVPAYTNLFWTFSIAALTVYFVTTLVNSSYGRGFLAVRDDEVAAEAMGINTTRYKIFAFVFGAFFAGVAGGLFGHFKQYLNPEGFNFLKSMDIVVMVIVGGMGNTLGVIIAAIVLTILPEALRPVAQYRMILYSFLLIVLMLTCPQGLSHLILTQWRRWRRSKPHPA